MRVEDKAGATDLRNRLFRLAKPELKSLALILNGLAILFYFLVAAHSGQLAELDSWMYWAPDAQGYRDISDWQLGRVTKPPVAAAYRPFLFPLVLSGVRVFTENAYAVWAVQFAVWLLALNFSSLTALSLTGRKSLYVTSFAIFALNASAIVQTFHALSEVLILCLTSIWTYLFARRWPPGSHAMRLTVLTLLAGLLVVVKPVFQLHLLLILIYLIGYGIRRPKTVPMFFLALSPVIVQLIMMNALIGRAAVSTISSHTLENYLSSQVYAVAESLSFDEARQVMDDLDTGQEIAYLARHPGTALGLYATNVMFQNLLQASDLVGQSRALRIFTRGTNAVYYGIHLAFPPLTIYVLVRRRDRVVKSAVLYLFSLLVIVSSGISFWQGDRLVITAMPFWLGAYMGVFHQWTQTRERRAARP